MRARAYAITLALTVLVGALYAGVPALHVPLHFVLAQFCHGVSTGKIWFLLGFICVAMVVLMVGLRPGANPIAPRWLPKAFWSCLLVGLAGAMGSYAYYVHRLNLPIDAPTFHWLHGRNSINSVVHTHTSKAIIALSLDWLGLERLQQKFDTGAPYARFVPIWLSVLIGASFIGALLCFFAWLPKLVARYTSTERASVALCATLASSACIKCILDGGPLAYDAVAGTLTLALLARGFSLRHLTSLARRAALVLLASVTLWLIVVALASFATLFHQLEHFAYRTCIHACILTLGAWWASRATAPDASPLAPADAQRLAARLRSPALASVALTIAIGVLASQQARTWLLPLYRPAPPIAVVYDDDAAGSTSHSVAAPAGAVERAYRALGDRPTRVRRVSFPSWDNHTTRTQGTGWFGQLVPLADGEPTGLLPAIREQRVIIARSELASDAVPTGAREASTRTGQDSPRGAFNVHVAFPGNDAPALAPVENRPLTALDENERFISYFLLDRALRRQGVDEYVVIPYVLYADLPRSPIDEHDGQRVRTQDAATLHKSARTIRRVDASLE